MFSLLGLSNLFLESAPEAQRLFKPDSAVSGAMEKDGHYAMELLSILNAHSQRMLQTGREALDQDFVLGARVPIVLTSRADSAKARLASCAVAVATAHHLRKGNIPAKASTGV